MGCYYAFSEGRVFKGPLDFSLESGTDRMFDLSRQGDVLETGNPFQIVLLSYDPLLDVPYRITMISPGHYAYVEFDKETFRKQPANLHQHNTFELVYVLSGTLFQRIESERHMYPEGSCLLLNRSVRHCEEYDTAFSTVSISLSAEYFRALLSEDRTQLFGTNRLWGDNTDLKEFLMSELSEEENDSKNYLDFIPRQLPTSGKDAIEVLFDKMTMALIQPNPGDAFFFRGYICQLLNLLCHRDLYTTRPIAIGTQSESRIFSRITRLLEENDGRISREMLVEKLRYSGSYLNRIVQTYTGMNITQYSLHFVMKRATYLLTDTDSTVTEIVSSLGFTNRTYFYNEFQKHYGQTPREYRLNHRK